MQGKDTTIDGLMWPYSETWQQ